MAVINANATQKNDKNSNYRTMRISPDKHVCPTPRAALERRLPNLRDAQTKKPRAPRGNKNLFIFVVVAAPIVVAVVMAVVIAMLAVVTAVAVLLPSFPSLSFRSALFSFPERLF